MDRMQYLIYDSRNLPAIDQRQTARNVKQRTYKYEQCQTTELFMNILSLAVNDAEIDIDCKRKRDGRKRKKYTRV